MSQKAKNVRMYVRALCSIFTVVFMISSCKPASSGGGGGLSKDTSLSALTLADKAVDQALAAKEEGWTADPVTNATGSVELIAKTLHKNAKVEVKLNGEAVNAGSSDKTKFNLVLKEGLNTAKVQVTAEDGKTKGKILTVKIKRFTKAEESVIPKVLKADDKDILPLLSNNIINIDPVKNEKESIIITAEPKSDQAKIELKCNDAPVASEAGDKTKFTCPLKEGDNKITVQVTAADGITKGEITINVHRNTKEENKDASLKVLKADDKNLFPLPSNNIINLGPVKNAVDSLLITAETKNQLASIELKCNDAPVASEAGDKTKFTCSLKEGDNVITLQVTAADDITKGNLITINVHRNTKEEDKDASLKVLKAENEDILSILSNNIINLGPVKNAVNSLLITAETKNQLASIELKCNKVLVASEADDKTKFTCLLKEGDNKITVQVTAADGITKGDLITINVYRKTSEEENSSLKSLTIDKAPGFIFDGTKTEYHDIPVPYEDVKITAQAYNGAEVKIDGKGSSDPGYGTVAISSEKLQVLVDVAKGGNSKRYTLNFVEAGAAVDVEVLVVDSIGGTKVSGTTLKVFDPEQGAGAGPVKTVQVNKGIANITGLTPNTRYDFKLEGIAKKWAGSLIEDYYVSALKKQKLTMIQFPHGDHTRGVEPPKVLSVRKVSVTGDETAIPHGDSIDNGLKSIKVDFSSSVGAVEEKAWNGFGAKVGMGLIPNAFTGIGGTYLGTTKESAAFTSKYEFELKPGTGDFIFPNGDFDLIVVGYDIANNRVEKHISIKSANSASGASLENAKFEGVRMISRRTPYSLNIYSNDGGDITHVDLMGGSVNGNISPLALDPIGEHSSSYLTMMIFSLSDKGQNVPIIGFDLYRRNAGTEDKFERVSRTIYGSRTVKPQYQGFDTDSRLEQNVEYEYKIIAYNASHTVESPVLKMKVMEAFTYELTAPAKHALILNADAQNISYTCKISNTKLLKKENADRFNSGLLVLNGQGEVLFGSRFRYYYNRKYKDGNSGPDLLIDIVNNGKVVPRISYQDVLKVQLAQAGITGLEALIKVNDTTGEITLTPIFTKIDIFNVVTGYPLIYTAGTTYQWDIQDWGNDPYDLYDDYPLMIIKDYKYTNPDSSTAIVQTQTWGNTEPNGANAVNGRFTFTVTE